MNYVILDLESTCDRNNNMFHMETIEFGAVYLNKNFEQLKTFHSMVKPVFNPKLTEFCKELTGINQNEVDSAKSFKTVFGNFVSWCGAEPFILCSYGFYDRKQLEKDCNFHNIVYPDVLKNHISVKHLFAQKYKMRACGMEKALSILKLPLEGSHHRALDDALNITTIFKKLYE